MSLTTSPLQRGQPKALPIQEGNDTQRDYEVLGLPEGGRWPNRENLPLFVVGCKDPAACACTRTSPATLNDTSVHAVKVQPR